MHDLKPIILDMWAAGYTYVAISKATGLRIGQISGCVHRHWRSLGDARPSRRERTRARTESEIRCLVVPEEIHALAAALPGLSRSACRYPVEGAYCGCKATRGRYCDKHHDLCHRTLTFRQIPMGLN